MPAGGPPRGEAGSGLPGAIPVPGLLLSLPPALRVPATVGQCPWGERGDLKAVVKDAESKLPEVLRQHEMVLVHVLQEEGRDCGPLAWVPQFLPTVATVLGSALRGDRETPGKSWHMCGTWEGRRGPGREVQEDQGSGRTALPAAAQGGSLPESKQPPAGRGAEPVLQPRGGMVPCQGRPVNSPRMAACFGLWGLWRERNHSLYSWVDTVQVSSGVTRWRRGRTPA